MIQNSTKKEMLYQHKNSNIKETQLIWYFSTTSLATFKKQRKQLLSIKIQFKLNTKKRLVYQELARHFTQLKEDNT